jgi:hypothetical protein
MTKHPFSEGTKLAQIFTILSDGKWHCGKHELPGTQPAKAIQIIRKGDLIMECTITISFPDSKLRKIFSKKICQDEFKIFCKNAVASVLFTQQFAGKTDNQPLDLTAKTGASKL